MRLNRRAPVGTHGGVRGQLFIYSNSHKSGHPFTAGV